jgi:hypothetical protein
MRFSSDAVNASIGVLKNQFGRHYRNGAAYGLADKARVAECYEQLVTEDGKEPSIERLRQKAEVSWTFDSKVVKELKEHGEVLDTNKIPINRAKGPGARTLDEIDEVILLDIRREDPQRPLKSYREELFKRTGTLVSGATICRWFLRRFAFRGSMVNGSPVPIDKFKPENIAYYREYLQWRNIVDPMWLRFVDEKLLRGEEIFARKTRRDPVTGEADTVIADPGFRNTHDDFRPDQAARLLHNR